MKLLNGSHANNVK